jgi:hypothetical protein
VYIAFGTRACDSRPFQGWIFGYRGSDLARVAVFNAGFNQAGIWQSGSGLASDNSSVYAFTGNSWNDDNLHNEGGNQIGFTLNPNSNSVLRLDVASGGSLSLASKYTPANQNILNQGDTDLASGGPVLIPGGPSGKIIGGGKEGVFFLLNRASMQPTAAATDVFQAAWQSWHPVSLARTVPCYSNPPPPFAGPMYPDRNGQIFTQAGTQVANCGIRKSDYQWGQDPPPNIHGSPAYFQTNSTTGFLYLAAEKDFLKAFKYDISRGAIVCGAGSLPQECDPTAISSTVRAPDGMPGGAVSVSANGTTNGVVWTIMPKIDAVLLDSNGISKSHTGVNGEREGQDFGKRIYARLVASDALTLQELWRDEADVPYTKFMPPTVAGGFVFRPTVSGGSVTVNPQSELVVYGPLSRRNWAAATAGPRLLLLN